MNKEIRKKVYIKLAYSLLDWEWYDDANTMRVFIHLLLTANRKDKPYHGDVIHRGEVLAATDFLAKELKLSIKNVRTALSHLTNTGEVAIRKIGKTSVIRVLNYDKYQSGGNESATKGQRDGNESATRRHRNGNESATPIDCNNEENDKNDIMKECVGAKHPHGKLHNVFLTDSDYKKFKSEYPRIAEDVIDQLSLKIAVDEKAYSDNHLAHLYIFARNYRPPVKKEETDDFGCKINFDPSIALKLAKQLDPENTKRKD